MKKNLISIVIVMLFVSMAYAADVTPTAVTADGLDFNAALAHSFESSGKVKQALYGLKSAEGTVEKTYSMFDLMATGSVTYTESKTEASSPFSPEDTKVLVYSAGLSNKIFTGGFLSLDFSSARTSLIFPAGSPYSALLSAYDPTYKPTLSVTLVQPLLKDFWGRPDEKAIKIGELTVALAKEGLRGAVLENVSSLKDAYFFIYLSDKMLEVQRDFYSDAESLYNETKSLQKIGLREETDLLQAKASLLSSKSEISSAEVQAKFARENYLNMAGYPQEEWDSKSIIISDSPEDIQAPETMDSAAEDRLIDAQPAVIMSKMGAEMSKIGKEMADSSALPSLNVIGSYGVEGTNGDIKGAFDKMDDNKFRNFMIGVNMSYSFPNRGGSGEVKIRENEMMKAEDNFGSLKSTLRIGIRAAYRKLQTAKMDYELKKEARGLLEKRLKIQEKSFSQGRISTRELIMSQSEYHGARLKEAAAILEYVKAGSAWNMMTGKYDVYYNEYLTKIKN